MKLNNYAELLTRRVYGLRPRMCQGTLPLLLLGSESSLPRCKESVGG